MCIELHELPTKRKVPIVTAIQDAMNKFLFKLSNKLTASNSVNESDVTAQKRNWWLGSAIQFKTETMNKSVIQNANEILLCQSALKQMEYLFVFQPTRSL